MSKRGQISIFIIAGILILLIASGFFFLRNKTTTKPLEAESKGLPGAVIQATFESCLESSGKDALVFVGKQGGYYNAPLDSEFFVGSNVPYYMKGLQIEVPELNQLEEQLSLAVKDILPKCLDEIAAFQEIEGVRIGYEIREINTKIGDDKISLQANIPVKISLKENQNIEAELNNFAAEISVKYKKLYDYSSRIIQLQSENPEGLIIGEIADLGFNDDLTFEIIAPESIISEVTDSDDPGRVPIIDNDHNKVLISLVSSEFFDVPYYFTFGILFDLDFEQVFADDTALEEETMNEVALALKEE